MPDYVGSAEVHVVAGTISEVRRYLGAVLLVQRKVGATYKVERQYFLTDAQGSTFAVLTEWGEPVNSNAGMSFDPFGARRDETSAQLMPWSPSLQADLDASTRHGYTGHEQVDKVGIIHMNGRIYDPTLGRFLQADPFIQDPSNSQSLNRYSYVLNNPLAFTDPTGYWGHKQQGYVRTAVAIVIAVWTGYVGGGMVANGAVAQGLTVAFAGGFAAGAIQSGTGKGALIGGLSAVVFTGINGYYGKVDAGSDFGLSATEYAERALANGAAGGVLASIQGQRFGSGFASAGLSSMLNPAVDSITKNPYGQGFMAAIVGGTVSEATGGKFANGAITAAFASAFSSAVSSAATGSRSGRVSSPSQSTDVSLVPGEYGSPEEAVNAFGQADAAAAKSSGSEYQTGIIRLMGGDGYGPPAYGYTTPFTGDPGSGVVPWGKYLPALQSTYGDALYGYAHIHADNNMIFSLYDYNFMHAGYSPLYLYNQNGETRMLTDAIVRSAVSSAGIQGANQTLLYAQRYNGFPGACVYGCGH